MGFSITISKKFRNGFEFNISFTGGDIMSIIIAMICLMSSTGVCESCSRQNEHN